MEGAGVEEITRAEVPPQTEFRAVVEERRPREAATPQVETVEQGATPSAVPSTTHLLGPSMLRPLLPPSSNSAA